MPLSATIKASITGDLTRAIDLAGASSPLARLVSIAFTDGVGANQANVLWHDQRTLAASAAESLDFAGGGLTDIYGNAISLARIKALGVFPAAANLNNLHVERHATAGIPLFLAASDGLILRPGGLFLWADPSAAGIVVTATSGDMLTLTNGAGVNSVTYDIVVIGAAT